MKKSKKAFTLVEIIVSLAIIALVSFMLVGILVPAAKMQGDAEQRNIGVNNAAQPLELPQPSPTAGASVSSRPTSISLGTGGTSDGTLWQSKDSSSGIVLYEFVPSTS